MSDVTTQAFARLAANYAVLKGVSVSGDPQAQRRLDVARIQAGERGVIPCDLQPQDCTLEELTQGPCPACDGTGQRLYRESVELRAYCGDPVAREVLLVERDCPDCGGTGEAHGWCSDRTCCKPGDSERDECGSCDGMGRRSEARFSDGEPLDLCDQRPLKGWLAFLGSRWGQVTLVRAACAAAGPVQLEEHEECEPLLCTVNCIRIYRAIVAARAWAECPCERHHEAWVAACQPVSTHRMLWVPFPLDRPAQIIQGIQDAAGHSTETAVREITCAELIAWALLEVTR